MSKNNSNQEKKFGYHQSQPARNSSVFLPSIDGKNYELSDPEVPVASSSRHPFSAPTCSSGIPILATVTPPPRYAAHKRPAPLINSGSVSSVTLTDSSSPYPSSPEPADVTPPTIGFKRPATPSRFAVHKRPALSSSPTPMQPSTPPLPSCCRPSSSIRRTISGSVPIQYKIPKYSPSNPGPIRFYPTVSAPLVIPRTQSTYNLTAALACSTFTPYEYSRKVKALEQLTGKRDTSINPYHLVVVTGIHPQPIRMVKQCLIGLSICVANVANINFNGKNTEFLVLKTYLSTFLYKISNNQFITIIHF
ncbi:hypothetical protein AYI70_g3666 [Smittium culicis]|uniref:Uncharacterized protein n=1 Tax=Smittium culicis TaxID=133412 RepID=A0A1R1Y2W5_9FUNG|nr:hypothetical protein AYI70_g3666 [Smittium culicis]